MDLLLQNRPEGEGVWLFAYGSLMWNPTFEFERSVTGLVRGWRRRFCLMSTYGRGTPEIPGLFLALDFGGSAKGVVFKLPVGREESELILAWRREMFSGAYTARWVKVSTEAGEIQALTFVANHEDASYRGDLSDNEITRIVATAAGTLGSNMDYLEESLLHLGKLNVRDRGLERIATMIEEAKLPSSSVSSAVISNETPGLMAD
jgi:cation transport protein ChaC